MVETALDLSYPKEPKVLMNSIVYQTIPSLFDPQGIPMNVSIFPKIV